MRRRARPGLIALAWLLLAMLGGCGLKGDLYLEETRPAPVVTAPAEAAAEETPAEP